MKTEKNCINCQYLHKYDSKNLESDCIVRGLMYPQALSSKKYCKYWKLKK